MEAYMMMALRGCLSYAFRGMTRCGHSCILISTVNGCER